MLLRIVIVSWCSGSLSSGLLLPILHRDPRIIIARSRLGSQDEGRRRRSARAESAKPKPQSSGEYSSRLAAHLPHPHLRKLEKKKEQNNDDSTKIGGRRRRRNLKYNSAKQNNTQQRLNNDQSVFETSTENRRTRPLSRRMVSNFQKSNADASTEKNNRSPRAVYCGYCGSFFSTRSSLFRHLRDDNDCRTQALSHGMPIENPLKGHDRALRRKFGDVLLAGCIVLHRLPENIPNDKELTTNRELSEGEADFIADKYECVLVHNRGGRLGFPKGKIELHDNSVLDAALRETWEEAGLSAHRLHILPRWVVTEAKRRSGVTRLWVGSNTAPVSNRTSFIDTSKNGDDTDFLYDDPPDDSDDDDDNPNTDPDLAAVVDDDDDDDDDELTSITHTDESALSSQYAGIDVREITGRHGKRARYFVCSLYDTPLKSNHKKGRTQDTSLNHCPPSVTSAFKLSSVNDVDGDIERVEWVNANLALRLLGYKRKTALRRAIVCYEIYHQNFLLRQQQQEEQHSKFSSDSSR